MSGVLVASLFLMQVLVVTSFYLERRSGFRTGSADRVSHGFGKRFDVNSYTDGQLSGADKQLLLFGLVRRLPEIKNKAARKRFLWRLDANEKYFPSVDGEAGDTNVARHTK